MDCCLSSGEVAALASGDFKQPGAIGFPGLNRDSVIHMLHFTLPLGDTDSGGGAAKHQNAGEPRYSSTNCRLPGKLARLQPSSVEALDKRWLPSMTTI
jgi:hypothetical protein